MEAAVTPITPELESFSPLDGARVGAVETIRPDAVQAVVDDVATVQPFWAQLPLNDRARYMRRAAQAIIDQLDELAELLSREQGKPINEAYVMELLPTIDSLRWLAEAARGSSRTSASRCRSSSSRSGRASRSSRSAWWA